MLVDSNDACMTVKLLNNLHTKQGRCPIRQRLGNKLVVEQAVKRCRELCICWWASQIVGALKLCMQPLHEQKGNLGGGGGPWPGGWGCSRGVGEAFSGGGGLGICGGGGTFGGSLDLSVAAREGKGGNLGGGGALDTRHEVHHGRLGKPFKLEGCVGGIPR